MIHRLIFAVQDAGKSIEFQIGILDLEHSFHMYRINETNPINGTACLTTKRVNSCIVSHAHLEARSGPKRPTELLVGLTKL